MVDLSIVMLAYQRVDKTVSPKNGVPFLAMLEKQDPLHRETLWICRCRDH